MQLYLHKESWSRYVSFEFRNGTCWCRFFNAQITSPNDDSDLLIAWASFNRSPQAADLLTRSEPARSTKFKRPYVLVLVDALYPTTLTLKTACDRLETSFKFVDAVTRVFLPIRSIWNKKCLNAPLMWSLIFFYSIDVGGIVNFNHGQTRNAQRSVSHHFNVQFDRISFVRK